MAFLRVNIWGVWYVASPLRRHETRSAPGRAEQQPFATLWIHQPGAVGALLLSLRNSPRKRQEPGEIILQYDF